MIHYHSIQHSTYACLRLTVDRSRKSALPHSQFWTVNENKTKSPFASFLQFFDSLLRRGRAHLTNKLMEASGRLHFSFFRRMPAAVFFENRTDFESEFINKFPINRFSVLEGFRSNQRHIFLLVRKTVRPAIFVSVFVLIMFLKHFFSQLPPGVDFGRFVFFGIFCSAGSFKKAL